VLQRPPQRCEVGLDVDRLASRPREASEWASELEQGQPVELADAPVHGRSEDRPVSAAKTSREIAKHSAIESKPDFEPSIENHGVQCGRDQEGERVGLEVISRRSRRRGRGLDAVRFEVADGGELARKRSAASSDA